jgi:putative ABC transport system ATP-binding protein
VSSRGRRVGEIELAAPDLTAEVELELDNIEVTYPGPVPVRALRRVSMLVRPGEFVAVTGRSGSGKSTMLNILGLLDRPTSGRYLVRGIDTSSLPEWAITALRAGQFGFVFQAFHLLGDRSAAENAEMGMLYQPVPARLRRLAAAQALDRVGLSHRMNAMPGTLSGGERQRVAIARALAQQPRVLLCDEPTGNLDRSSSDQIISLLAELNAAGLTVIVVTHDEQIAASLPRRVHIDDGTVTEHPPATADLP